MVFVVCDCITEVSFKFRTRRICGKYTVYSDRYFVKKDLLWPQKTPKTDISTKLPNSIFLSIKKIESILCEEVKTVDYTYITEISFCWFNYQYNNIIEHSPGIVLWRTHRVNCCARYSNAESSAVCRNGGQRSIVARQHSKKCRWRGVVGKSKVDLTAQPHPFGSGSVLLHSAAARRVALGRELFFLRDRAASPGLIPRELLAAFLRITCQPTMESPPPLSANISFPCWLSLFPFVVCEFIYLINYLLI